MDEFWSWFRKGMGFMLAIGICLFVVKCTTDDNLNGVNDRKACEADDGFELSRVCLKNSIKAGYSK